MQLFISAALFRPLVPKSSRTSGKTFHLKAREDAHPEKPNTGSATKPENKAENSIFSSYLSLFKLKSFVIFCIALSLGYGCLPLIGFLPALSEQRGFGRTLGTLSISVIGITDIFARIICGFIYDLKFVRPRRKYVFAAFIMLAALSCFLFTIVQHYVGLLLLPVLFGIGTSNIISQRVLILADFVSPKQVPNAIGISSLFLGASLLTAPAVAGKYTKYVN